MKNACPSSALIDISLLHGRLQKMAAWLGASLRLLKDLQLRYDGRELNLSKPTGHVMHQQFNIQQLYALPTLYLCVSYLSENKQPLVPLTA